MKHKQFGLICSLVIGATTLISSPSPAAANVLVAKNYCSQEIQQFCSPDKPYTPNISRNSSLIGPQIASQTREINNTPTPLPTQSILPVVTPSSDSESTASPKILPTHTPDPTPEPTIVPEPTPEVTIETGGNNPDVIFNLINTHRSSKGLPDYQKDDRLCAIAQTRIPQLHNEMFGGNYIHQGFDEMDHEYWITENMVYQPDEQSALNWWLNSGLHRTAIESSQHTHSCGACSGRVCIQLFSSFIPR